MWMATGKRKQKRYTLDYDKTKTEYKYPEFFLTGWGLMGTYVSEQMIFLWSDTNIQLLIFFSSFFVSFLIFFGFTIETKVISL